MATLLYARVEKIMSVVALWNGRMGADTMGNCSVTGLWLPQQKVYVVNNEIALGVCGDSVTHAEVNAAALTFGTLISYMEREGATTLYSKEEYTEETVYMGDDPINTIFSEFHGTTVLLMTKDARYFAENYMLQRYDNNLPLVVGTGAPVAITGLLWGCTMEESIRLATRHASLARGEPSVAEAKDLKRIKRKAATFKKIAGMVRI